MQFITIAGRLGKDAVLATTQGGKSVCNFSVAVDTGFGDNKTTNWWRCALWGTRGEKLAQHLLKGTSVTVAGRFSLGDYEGKPQLNVDVSELTLQGSRQGGQRAEPEPRQQDSMDADLDSDVPFALTISDEHERRMR